MDYGLLAEEHAILNTIAKKTLLSDIKHLSLCLKRSMPHIHKTTTPTQGFHRKEAS